MKDTLTTVVIGGAVIGAGALAYHYATGQTAAPAAPAGPSGFQPPANLLNLMQGAWSGCGRPTDPGRWASCMNGAVPVGNAWSYVYPQWLAVYQPTGAWPSNGQLQGWLQYAVNNGLGGRS